MRQIITYLTGGRLRKISDYICRITVLYLKYHLYDFNLNSDI